MKSPISMRNGRLNTSKYKGKFQKMGMLYTHSLKMPGPSPNFQKQKIKKKKNIAKKRAAHNLSNYGRDQRATSSHLPAAAWRGPPFLYKCHLFFQTLAPLFGHMWSIFSHWLQHMPNLPRLLLEFSTTHDFWSVVPKIMKFVFM